MSAYSSSGQESCSLSYCYNGYAYDNGEGVERDAKKAQHYYELAAIGGERISRNAI